MIDYYNKDHLPVPSCSTRVMRPGRNKRPYTQLQRRLSKVLLISIIIILILFINSCANILIVIINKINNFKLILYDIF